MRIEPLLRVVESYLSGRSAILWALEDRAFTASELKDILDVQNDMIFRRRHNPTSWRPSELKQLANVFRLSSEPITNLQNLAFWLQSLPDGIRGKLLKEAHFDRSKLKVRLQNPDAWQYDELGQLVCVLRRWQDSRNLSGLCTDLYRRQQHCQSGCQWQ